MLAVIVESTLRDIGSETITNLFLWGLLASFALALFFKKTNRSHSFTQYAPTLLTTIGILGTFAGIISGLLGFNVDDINGSINLLLSGLKTAFTTSLVGMTLSIAYKLIVSTGVISPKHADTTNEDEIGVAELYTVMREQAAGLEALKSSIAGDSHSSLVEQLKLIRADLSDQHDAILAPIKNSAQHSSQLIESVHASQQAFETFQEQLWTKLQDFADMLSKSATEQVIQALKEVISDFNSNLTEQFGESFRQLNTAVLELVQWQENYKQQLGQMSEQYQQGVQAITQTEAAVTRIGEESQAIPVNMELMKSVLGINRHQLQELERHLESFRDIRDRAVEAVPEIREQIDQTVTGMQRATTTINDGLAQTTQTLTAGLNNAAETVTSEIGAAVRTIAEGVVSSTDVLAANVTAASEKMSESVTESSLELGRSIISSGEEFRENSDRVNSALQGSSDVIMKNSEETRQMYSDALSETNSVLRTMVADLKDDSSKLAVSYRAAGETLVVEMNQVQQAFEKGLDSMRKALAESLKSLAERQEHEQQRVLEGLSHNADEALKNTSESVTRQTHMLEEATQHQLTEVMNEFGRALTTITRGFTDDYRKLINEMHRITRAHTEV